MECFAIALVLFFGVDMARSASTTCEVSYYRELGCEPVTDGGGECPTYYTCPDLHPDPTVCYYKGVSYKSKDFIPDEAVKNPCSVACYCEVSNTTTSNIGSDDLERRTTGNTSKTELQTRFQCAAVDCVEDYTSDVEEECVPTYTLDACCSSGKVCGKDEISKLATCEVDTRTYRQGQQFYPANTCLVCICTPEFNGTFDGAPYCRDIDCGIEIHNQMEIAEKCAPVVMSGSSCCPHKWECPDNSTTVTRSTDVSRANDQASCQFGEMTLRIGDRVSVKDKCVECSCQMPPFVSCIQQAGCN